jgi:hypothetical protein
MAKSATANLRMGECACILNPRTGKGVSVCKVPKSQSRSGIKFRGKCPFPKTTK